MLKKIKTLYLVPHAHTDFGYTHDPLITWELHDHFLDRAIELCESTVSQPQAARYRWTIEVFATLEHWWARRDEKMRERLLVLMRDGRIDLGLRYTNGTFLHDPLNLEWEVQRATRFCTEHGLRCTNVFQNDINGFSIAHARAFVRSGCGGLVMGLNTTMGVSPQPRPGAFWWNLGEGDRLLVWHGWIYNRIGRWVHLHKLSTGLDAAWPEIIARLPEDYPFDFVMMSGTIGDNVGPFPRLPEEVAAYNALGTGLEVRLATISEFMKMVAAATPHRELSGDWNDAWCFGSGSMPHEVAMLRRAQRRLSVVDGIQRMEPSTDVFSRNLFERAQHEVSMACEHTYESHTTTDDHTFSDDGKRQWVQCQASFTNAESLSMLALRRTLFEAASKHVVDRPSVLLINPTDHALPAHIRWNSRIATNIVTSEVLEHLAQFDREPTLEGLAREADIGLESILLPPRSRQVVPLQALDRHREAEVTESPEGATLSGAGLKLQVGADGRLESLRLDKDPAHEWINTAAPTGTGRPFVERPAPGASFKYKSESEKRDPSDAEWNPDLRFIQDVSGKATRLSTKLQGPIQEAVVDYTDSPVRQVIYRLDALTPGLLHIELELRMDDDGAQKAFYFPLAFALPGEGAVSFLYDSCGEWTEVIDGQLPGSATSFYNSQRGMVMRRGGRCVQIISPDAPLWQAGGFTFGHPHTKPDRSHATLLSWLYNNYWYTNFPSAVPGWFRVRYLIACDDGDFSPTDADRLHHHFHVPYMIHPIWPKQT